MPLFEGVEIDIDLVWLPWRSSLLAFFKMGSKILRSGCNMNLSFIRYVNQSIINCKLHAKYNKEN